MRALNIFESAPARRALFACPAASARGCPPGCCAAQEHLQRDINATMRGILVDWLVEVAEEYKLWPDTLFLSVAFIDRCLSTMQARARRCAAASRASLRAAEGYSAAPPPRPSWLSPRAHAREAPPEPLPRRCGLRCSARSCSWWA